MDKKQIKKFLKNEKIKHKKIYDILSWNNEITTFKIEDTFSENYFYKIENNEMEKLGN